MHTTVLFHQDILETLVTKLIKWQIFLVAATAPWLAPPLPDPLLVFSRVQESHITQNVSLQKMQLKLESLPE